MLDTWDEIQELMQEMSRDRWIENNEQIEREENERKEREENEHS